MKLLLKIGKTLDVLTGLYLNIGGLYFAVTGEPLIASFMFGMSALWHIQLIMVRKYWK